MNGNSTPSPEAEFRGWGWDSQRETVSGILIRLAETNCTRTSLSGNSGPSLSSGSRGDEAQLRGQREHR